MATSRGSDGATTEKAKVAALLHQVPARPPHTVAWSVLSTAANFRPARGFAWFRPDCCIQCGFRALHLHFC